MSALLIKAIALLSMTVDHIGYFTDIAWMRIVGRFAFPLYCFLIANGAKHTKHPVWYLLRLLLFAFLAEPFYCFGFYGEWFLPGKLNVLFTLAAGLACLLILDKCRDLPRVPRFLLSAAAVAGCLLLSQNLGFEYGWGGAATVLLFGAFSPEDPDQVLPLLCSLLGVALAKLALPILGVFFMNRTAFDPHTLPLLGCFFGDLPGTWEIVQLFSLLSVFLVSFYNGKKGTVFGKEQPEWMKYFFYVYYPAHIMILSLLLK